MLNKDIYTTSNDLSPIVAIKAVTPSDSVDLPDGPTRAILITGAGNLKVTTANGDVVTLPISTNWFGVTYLRVARIWATGTTVSTSNIFACY
jgi:hypothetical protein